MSDIDFQNGLVVGMTLAGKNGLVGKNGVINVGAAEMYPLYNNRFGPNINKGEQILLQTEVSTVPDPFPPAV